MSSNFNVFESAISALSSNSAAISVVSQNIANVNTPGYSRQQAILVSRDPQSFGGQEVGRGVEIASIRRVVDGFVESRLRDSATSASQTEVRANNLLRVEAAFNELSRDGLATQINNFFGAFHELSADPSTTSARQNLLNAGGNLVDTFQTIDSTLTELRQFIDGQISNDVSQINNLATEIVALNEEIRNADTEESLVLEDQRTLKTRELAELIDVQVVVTSEDIYQVYIGDGIQFINGATKGALDVERNASNDNHYDVTYQVGSGTATTITSRISGGELKGLIDVRDTDIPSYADSLDELAYEIATEVNTLHSAGFALDGTDSRDFFGTLASSDGAAGDISISSDVDGSPENIAASGAATDIPGGNATALSIASLQSSDITFGAGDNTFVGFYSDLLATVGADTSSASGIAAFNQDVYRQAQVAREKISGVSLEEEQLELVRYQSAFQAATRLISVASDILERLANLV